MDWYRRLPGDRRRTVILLVGAILLTLPCYCCGFTLLIVAPPEQTPMTNPSATTSTATGADAASRMVSPNVTGAAAPSATPEASFTPPASPMAAGAVPGSNQVLGRDYRDPLLSQEAWSR